VWYSIDAPERVTIFQIKGDIEDIERSPGKTEARTPALSETHCAYQVKGWIGGGRTSCKSPL
jgi:hypothetical protein